MAVEGGRRAWGTIFVAGTEEGADVRWYGFAGVELTLGRVGVGSAEVLTTAVPGEGIPAEDVRPGFCCRCAPPPPYMATEVEEEGAGG